MIQRTAQALPPSYCLLLLRHPACPAARQLAVQHVPKPFRQAIPLTFRPHRRLNALPPAQEGRSQLAAHEVRQTLAQQPHRRSALRRPRRPRVPARRQIVADLVIQRTTQVLIPSYCLLLLRHPACPAARQLAVQHVPNAMTHHHVIKRAAQPLYETHREVAPNEKRQAAVQPPQQGRPLRRHRRPRAPPRRQIAADQVAQRTTHALAPPRHLLLPRHPPLPPARQPVQQCRCRSQLIFQGRHAAQGG